MVQVRRRVLVVDDEPTIAASVAARLRAEGFVVDGAHDGPTAIARFGVGEPGLVVLDVTGTTARAAALVRAAEDHRTARHPRRRLAQRERRPRGGPDRTRGHARADTSIMGDARR